MASFRDFVNGMLFFSSPTHVLIVVNLTFMSTSFFHPCRSKILLSMHKLTLLPLNSFIAAIMVPSLLVTEYQDQLILKGKLCQWVLTHCHNYLYRNHLILASRSEVGSWCLRWVSEHLPADASSYLGQGDTPFWTLRIVHSCLHEYICSFCT